jgi:arginase
MIMDRPIAILGAPSSIGIRPYDSGEARHLDQAPDTLRQLGLIKRLRADDFGDVHPPAYRDYVRPAGRARNEAEVLKYSRMLADRVEAAGDDDHFVVVLGGDCSIVLGSLLGAVRRVESDVGLVYVDAHADFAAPEESLTGSIASMCLALAVGRGNSPLARLRGAIPLVSTRHVALLGRRDAAEPWYGHTALAASPILDLPDAALRNGGLSTAARAALSRVTSPDLGGFWIHLDADVINPAEMPAVDSPEPGGPVLDEVAELLTPLVRHPRALGLEVTIYDPSLDTDRSCAVRLAALLEQMFRNA